jgi:hypothetical protein
VIRAKRDRNYSMVPVSFSGAEARNTPGGLLRPVITTRAGITRLFTSYSTGEIMCKNTLYRLLIAFLILIGSSHVQAGVQKDRTKWRHLDKRLLTRTTIAALERWYTDSLGCMNLRKWDDGQILIDRFKLRDANKDSVIKVLGQPNYVVDAPETTTWSYHIYKGCENGLEATPAKGISIKISRRTNKVIDVSLAVY